jgi:purine nucleosidase
VKKIITKEGLVYMDVDLSHGVSYGDTLTWIEKLKPEIAVGLVHAQLDLDPPKFKEMFVKLISSPIPRAVH